MTFIYPTKKVDEIEAEILESATPSAAYLLRWLIGAVRERDAEIDRREAERLSMLADFTERDAEIERLNAEIAELTPADPKQGVDN